MSTILTTRFELLTPYQLYDLLRLRAEVFVVEQNCVYQDLDNSDQKAMHFLMYHQDELIGYARVLPPELRDAHWHIGRVVVAKKARGKGAAKELMRTTLRHIAERNAAQLPIYLMAQSYLLAFYSSFGFEARGEEFLEDGIPHVNMFLEKLL